MLIKCIKQNMLSIKDQQIELARELHDSQLVREYQEQKRGVLQAFSMVENGY